MFDSKKPTIGLVLPYLKSRGTEIQALRLAKGFINNGSRVILFVVQGWGIQRVYDDFCCAGVEIVNIGPPAHIGEKKVNLLRFIVLAKSARKHKCNILISRAGMTNKCTGYAGIIGLVPTIAVISNAVIPKKPLIKKRLSDFISMWINKINLGFPSHIITVSNEGRKNLISMYPSMADFITSIQNGVNISAIQNLSLHFSPFTLPQDKFNICYAGSIEINRKGLDTLINAVYDLVQTYHITDLHLTLIGTGIDIEIVKTLINEYSLSNYVTFTGESDNPHCIITQADLFILPSRREGFPNVLLEAMALGVCCIAADCDTGPREIITNNVNGILYPAENHEFLVRAIIQLKENDKLRTKMGLKGEITIRERFNERLMVEKYYQLIQKIIGNN